MSSITGTRREKPAPHRSPRANGTTKEGILNSAELLFADGDVAKVTMRAIDTVALAVMISMSATILVSTAMVVLNVWSAPGGVAVLIAIALLGFAPFGRGTSSPRPQS